MEDFADDELFEDAEADVAVAAPQGDEAKEKLSWAARRRQKAEAKAAAKAARIAEKQAKIDAKAEAKAARAAAKQAKIDSVAEAKAARIAAKQAKVDAAAEAKTARAAAKQAKLDAATEAKAARAAAKQEKADAAAEAKAARAAASQEKTNAKAEAKAAKIAAKQSKADAKNEAKAAKVAAKLARTEAVAPSITDRQTEEIQKNVLEAVSLGDAGITSMPPAVAPESEASKQTATPPDPAPHKPARSARKPMRQRVAQFRATVTKVYKRLPERPSRQQFLRATAVFVLLVEPWLVPIVSLIAVVSLTFAYFAMGPDRAAEITGAGYRWLQKREPERAEKVRKTAEKVSEKMSGWITRLPDRWSRGLHVPDFSKDNGKNDALIEDRFARLAREARSN